MQHFYCSDSLLHQMHINIALFLLVMSLFECNIYNNNSDVSQQQKKMIQVIYSHYDINGCKDEYKATFAPHVFGLELDYIREDLRESVIYNAFKVYNKQLNFKRGENNWFNKETGELYKSFDLKPPGGWTVEGFSRKYEFVEKCENFMGFEVIKLQQMTTSPLSPEGRITEYQYLIKIDPINELFTKEQLNHCGKLFFRHLDNIPSEYIEFSLLYKTETVLMNHVHTRFEITDILISESLIQ